MPFKPIADESDYPEKSSPRPKNANWIAKHQEENMRNILGENMWMHLSRIERKTYAINKT